jgi:hypothetical protein
VDVAGGVRRPESGEGAQLIHEALGFVGDPTVVALAVVTVDSDRAVDVVVGMGLTAGHPEAADSHLTVGRVVDPSIRLEERILDVPPLPLGGVPVQEDSHAFEHPHLGELHLSIRNREFLGPGHVEVEPLVVRPLDLEPHLEEESVSSDFEREEVVGHPRLDSGDLLLVGLGVKFVGESQNPLRLVAVPGNERGLRRLMAERNLDSPLPSFQAANHGVHRDA